MRNERAVSEALAQMDEMIRKQQIQVDLLSTSLQAMATRMTELERLVILIKSTSIGHGPSDG